MKGESGTVKSIFGSRKVVVSSTPVKIGRPSVNYSCL
ncbi:hypothetical protein ABIB62_001370 [Mucilaginibacter sp. UYP25]